MLMLLGIAGHYTPHLRQRLAKAAALLGSFDEAIEMLAVDGIQVSVNQLRDVTEGMGQMLHPIPDRRWAEELRVLQRKYSRLPRKGSRSVLDDLREDRFE